LRQAKAHRILCASHRQHVTTNQHKDKQAHGKSKEIPRRYRRRNHDGRIIERVHIEQMAKNYDPKNTVPGEHGAHQGPAAG
jgi:hypothetical protein